MSRTADAALPALEAPSFSDAADVHTSTDQYARRFAGPVGAYFLETQAAIVLDLLRPWPRARVLDLGGGHAQIAGPLVHAGFSVTVAGSDESCRRRLDRLLPAGSFSFVAADLLATGLPERSFDVVLALRLVSHVVRWPALIAEMCRLARRAVVLDYPERRSANIAGELLYSWKRTLERDTRRYRCFTAAELRSELSRHGFGREARRPEFLLPMVLHRVLRLPSLSRAVEAAAARAGATRRLGSPVLLRAERIGGAD